MKKLTQEQINFLGEFYDTILIFTDDIKETNEYMAENFSIDIELIEDWVKNNLK